MLNVFLLIILYSCSQSESGHKHFQHHRFNNAEEWTQKFDDPNRDLWQKPHEILKIMKIEEGDRIADIGAGTGYMISHLNNAVGPQGRVFALDVEPDLIKFMNLRIQKNNYKNSEIELIPFDNPNLAGKNINKVLFVNTWHHIQHPIEYAKKVRDQLVRSGIVYLVEPDPGTGGPGPKHRISAEHTIKHWKEAGFSCHQEDETLLYQYIINCLVLY